MKRRNLWRSKLTIAILALAVMVGLLAGCAGKNEESGSLTAAEVAERIEKSADLSNMKQGDANRLEKLYHLTSNDLEDFVLFTASSNVKADELLVIRLKEASETDRVMEQIEQRIAAQAAKFKDYRPEQYFLIEKRVLKTNGRYILFSVSAEADSMERIFDEVVS